jgi:hypothetical protein
MCIGFLCLFIQVGERSFRFKKYMNPSPSMPWYLCMVKVLITIAFCFMMHEAHGWEHPRDLLDTYSP